MNAWLLVACAGHVLMVMSLPLLTIPGVDSSGDDAYTVLHDWVLSKGGTVRGRTATVDHVRGLYADRDVAKDEVLLSIPETTVINAGSASGDIITPILTYLREALTPGSRFKPYLDTLPQEGDTLNACTMPLDHVAVLQSPFWHDHVSGWQAHLEAAWRGEQSEHQEFTFREVLGDVNVSLQEVQHACVLVTTRYLSNARGRLILAPIYDLCNHRTNCPNYLTTGDKGELIMRAGRDLKEGDEICNTYGDLHRDDYLSFNYGFLPSEQDPPRLLAVDHRLFREEELNWILPEDDEWEGTEEEYDAELDRLQAILQTLEEVPPPPLTPSAPSSLELMLKLRERRVRALHHEVARLAALRDRTKEEL